MTRHEDNATPAPIEVEARLGDAQDAPSPPSSAGGSVGIFAALLVVALVPFGALLASGTWDPGTLGLAAVAVVAAGTGLVVELVGRYRARR